MSQVPGYLVVLARVQDRPRFGAYVGALPPVYQQYGGRYLAVAPAATVEQFGAVEAAQSVVVSAWPSLDGLLRFWSSAEYREVVKLRDGTGEFIVAGLGGDGSDHAVDLAGMEALVLILGAPLSPAIVEAEGGTMIARARSSELKLLEGRWTQGDVAIFSFARITKARAVLSQISSGERRRGLILPLTAPARAAAPASTEAAPN